MSRANRRPPRPVDAPAPAVDPEAPTVEEVPAVAEQSAPMPPPLAVYPDRYRVAVLGRPDLPRCDGTAAAIAGRARAPKRNDSP